MKDAYTIALAIVKLSIEREKETNDKSYFMDFTKLHKMLYFAQCYSLAKYDEPLFFENVRSHDCGPYIEALSRFCGDFGIGEYTNEIMESAKMPDLTEQEREAVLFVIVRYGKEKVDVVVFISKKSEPYQKNKEPYRKVIPLKDMRKYGEETFKVCYHSNGQYTVEEYIRETDELIENYKQLLQSLKKTDSQSRPIAQKTSKNTTGSSLYGRKRKHNFNRGSESSRRDCR